MKAMARKRASNQAGLRQLLLGATRTSALVWLVVSMGVMCIAYSLLFSQPTVQTWIGGFRRIGPQLIDATTEELINGLQRGEFTSVDLVNAYISRIYEVNSTLRAVVEINPEAVAIAAALDAERAMGITRGPLHGLPYLLKNNIATKDEMNTTAGSYALLGAKVPRDATVVAKLRAAGVVILGKTNLSQWAQFRSAMGSSPNGWSAIGGQVLAPYRKMLDPCGSSSGSGVAATLGLAVAALGTETDGSIICPSGANSVVGIKPTVGLTSRTFVIPISEHQDTVGPMARTVKDAAYLLQAIAGEDPSDNYTSAIPFNTIPDYVGHCKSNALQGARIGVPRNVLSLRFQPEVILDAFEVAIQAIRDAGATVVDEANVTEFAIEGLKDEAAYFKFLQADFLSDLPHLYLTELVENPNNITSVKDLQQFTQAFELEDYPDRNTGIWDEALEQGLNNTDPQFWPLYERNLRVGGPEGVIGVLQNHSLDALILPTMAAATLSARIGGPVVDVPMGHCPPDHEIMPSTRGLVMMGPNIPFGLSFIGLRWSEAKLISLAYAFEQRTQARGKVKPYIAPTTELRDVMRYDISEPSP